MFRYAEVVNGYNAGYQLRFDGETEPTEKRYFTISNETIPNWSRVLVVKVDNDWIILGTIKKY